METRMRMTTSISLSLFAAAALIGGSAVAHGDGTKLQTTLTGANVSPGPGDTDGTGTATVTVDSDNNKVCYKLQVSGIAAATAAHIHKGLAGTSGPVVVGLAAPNGGTSNGCVAVAHDLAKDLSEHSKNYYVNVHNDEFPNGAVRGQLSK
jgi:hypothetical protein